LTTYNNDSELLVRSYNKKKLGRLQKRRKVRRAKIFLNRLRVVARLASYVFIVWAFWQVIHLRSWYLDENIFTVYPNPNLEIEGNSIVSVEQAIEKLSEIRLPKKPLYLVDTALIEKKLLELTPVKKVVIRRYWLPARLRVVIDERTPVVSIAPTLKSEPIAVFTKDGLEENYTVKIIEREFLPISEGFRTYKIITYDDYKMWKPGQISYIEELSRRLEIMSGDTLVYLDMRNPDDIYAQMEHVRLRIGGLKGKEVFRRIEKLAAVIPEAIKIKEKINYIDLRWHNVSIKLKKKETETLQISL